MLLAIDCGNTHITMGIYNEDRFVRHWRLTSDGEKTEDEYIILLNTLLEIEGLKVSDIDAIAIASVVPEITRCWQVLARSYLGTEALVIDNELKLSMPILMDNPQEMGADRIVDALAAYTKYGGDSPLIVVDFGTATTFDCISQKGEYLGGAITPGIEISQEALFQRAALLSRVPIVPPQNIIGKNTAECLQIGFFIGYASQVDGVVEHLKQELGSNTRVIATGGLAGMIFEYSKTIESYDVLLALDGLKLAYDKFKKR
ncbi:MAG: type III pantothenate kinase [Bacillota bacterium]|jgi:type III pantothenate kinase